MEVLIEARHVRKSFGSLIAVDDLQLQIAEGEIYGLIGPDGAGKTTTMRLLCGGLTPDSVRSGVSDGKPLIRIAGYDLEHKPEQARSQIGYLAQRFSLYEELTVLENIRFFAEMRGLQAAEWRPRCLAILEFVGLASFQDRRAGQLSGGMKQKLGLAAALVHQPRVLLLDEPTTGVDPVTRQDFWQLIIRLVGETRSDGKRTVVFISTPYMDEAARCSRIGFMQHGRMILEGTPAALRSRLDGRIIELVGMPLMLIRRIAQEATDVRMVQMFGDRLHIHTQPDQTEIVLERLSGAITSQGGQVVSIRMVPPGLEDVFMDLLQSNGESI